MGGCFGVLPFCLWWRRVRIMAAVVAILDNYAYLRMINPTAMKNASYDKSYCDEECFV